MRLGFRLLRSLLVACCVASFVMAPALAQVSTGTDVSGTIVDRSTGLPVAGATVALYAGDIVAGTMTTDVNGTYTFPAVATGEHYIEITALGFGTSRSDHFSVAAGRPVVLQNAIERVSADRGDLKNIATVNVGGSRDLQTTTVIHSDIDASTLQRENFVRVGDALNAIPGVNLASQSSAVGDDVFVNIRGVGVTESATLLDGHPIGPVGVAAGTFFNGAPTAFDFQDTPSFALRNIQTVFGSGALGLYGSDAIGGVVDLQTLDPTPAAEFRFHQGIGNNGQSTNVISASGTNGRLGYVFVNGVEGSYGNFAPQTIAQTGLLGTDYRSATLTANTYPVSGNYLLRTDLLKLRYALSPATTLTLTGYSGTSWDDKSGNGDNDFLTFDQQFYTGNQTIANGGSTITNPATTNTFSCQPGTAGENGNPTTPGIAVLTNAGPACYTAQQFARASNGPAGGGVGPFQAIRNQDYHARLQSIRGHSELTFDAYRDNYAVDYNRNLAGGLDPTGKFYVGGFDATFVRTTGYLASDDIVSDRNDFGFGVFALRHDLTGSTYDTTNLVLQPNQALGLTETNFFVRDVLDVSPRLRAFFNGWLKHTTVTDETKIDPRLSLVYRASPNDVVRLTGGNSSSAPTPSLRLGTSSLNQTPQNITPNCGGPTGIGGVGNPAVSSETGSDVELAIGHRFHADSLVQLSFYRESLNGKIFNVSEPINVLGANVIPPNLLAGYVQRLQQFCPNYSGLTPAQTLALLSVTTPVNIASGILSGFELAGRARLNQNFFLDYSYDVQSAVLNGVPDSFLKTNPTIINGSQILGIPLHKATLGFAYSSRHGFDARFDTAFIGDNNGYNRPGYTYTDASVSQQLGRRTLLNLGVFNLFNQASDRYGRIGLGQFHPENQFGTDRNPFDQASERFGLPPTQVQLSVTQQI